MKIRELHFIREHLIDNCPFWKIQKIEYSLEQTLHPEKHCPYVFIGQRTEEVSEKGNKKKVGYLKWLAVETYIKGLIF